MRSVALLELLDKEDVCARFGHQWRILEGEKRICVRCKTVLTIEIVR